MNKKKKISLFFILVALVTTVITVTTLQVKGDTLESGVHLFEDDELTYYINVYYDGKDVDGIESNDTTLADIRSGYIYVEDKLPAGLIFEGFVETADGSIGAVSRSDGSSCQGEVVNGVKGLKYNSSTRTVTFTARNLRAGCMLTVGIKTTTPILTDGITRMDFYNTAYATEGLETVTSNTVHAWIGEEATENATKYKVVYQYSGTVPDNASALPTTAEYLGGSKVGVAGDATAVGYTFSGWKTSNVTVSNGEFTMPTSTVTFTGSFTAIPTYSVSYAISGVQPEGYVLPTSKAYYEGMRIDVDTLEKGDIINGYRFLGWTTTDVTIGTDLTFEMPASNVTITGIFEEVTYNVIYKFQGSSLPTNSESLLPATKAYKPGETVALEAEPTAEGYRFLGWYKEDNFEMPNEDVVIYGEWAIEVATFEPTIVYEVINKQDSYRPGETVEYKITVTNNEDYALTDVVVQGITTKPSFVENKDYELTSTRLAKIANIPAGKSVVIYEEYVVPENAEGTFTSEIELIGALGSKAYTALDVDKNYLRSNTITVASRLNLCNTADSENGTKVFLYHMTGTNYDSWAILNKNECKTIYLTPGTYKIEEVEPQDYTLTSVTGDLTTNGGFISIGLGKEYEVTFNNIYAKKAFYQMFGRLENIIKEAGDSA